MTHVSVAFPLIKLMSFELREAQWEAGVRAWSNTHTHTHSDTSDTQDGWRLGQGPAVILTHVRVAP